MHLLHELQMYREMVLLHCGTLKAAVFWQYRCWCQPHWRGPKGVYQRRGRKEGQLNQTDSRRKAPLWAFCLGHQDTTGTIQSLRYMLCHGDVRTAFVVRTQRSLQCSSLSDLALAGLVAGTQIILELAQAQTPQRSNHTEGLQEHTAPSTAGKE